MSEREKKIENAAKVIEKQWKKNREQGTVLERLSVRIGKNETGFVELDLHEKGDGPHMLVAGTTGSGKTETIITYLLGLCMNFGPEEINLLLVDMKGGGFTKRIGHLPHVVGHITDVEGDENGTGAEYMLRRFLYAMTAEIKRRKKLFNQLHVDSIDDYIKRYKEIEQSGVEQYAKEKHIENGFDFKDIHEVSRLAHLILVVDEFTELKRFSSQSNDVDFISEITTIARVGRSLGFHIILISQNIEGAITDDIRVNSNARLCHKVATPQASKEMIGSALAAAPSMPGNGRAYLLSGNGKRLEYFQAGYSKTDTDEVVPMKIELAKKSGAYTTFYNSEKDNEVEKQNKKRKEMNGEYLTQLELLTGAICKAYEKQGNVYHIHKIFKQPLESILELEKLEKGIIQRYNSVDRAKMEKGILLGQYDDPERQKQPAFRYEHTKQNLLVFGSSGSGKTALLKTLLLQMHRQNLREKIYIIDFGGGIGAYRKLQKVYGCFDNSNEENVKRIFKTVREELNCNIKQLGSESFAGKQEKDPQNCPSHITLIIENINAFLGDERYSTYRDELLCFCRDGVSKGLTVVATAKEISGLARLMVHFGKRIAFEMPSDSYWDIFNAKLIKPMKTPGRGLADCDSQVLEMQAAFVKEEREKQLLSQYSGDIEGKLVEIPEEEFDYPVNKEMDEGRIVVGRDYYKQEEVTVDFEKNRCVAIYGKRQFGKTNLLQLLLIQIEKRYPGKYVYFLLDDGRKQLDEEHLSFFYQIVPRDRFIHVNGKAITHLGEIANDQPRVVVLQGREFYNGGTGSGYSFEFVEWVEAELGDPEYNEDILIFSDVRRVSSSLSQEQLKSWIQIAFLLDNIGDFVTDRGKDSVFGEMDAKELKAEYARCNLGDGFFYEVEADELKKLRFYKCINEK